MFQHSSFSPASFSFQAFKMAQQDQARSGYWRLFYTELQEKSLEEDRLKREQKQREEAPQRKSKGSSPKPVESKPAKRVRDVPKYVDATHQVKLKPLFRKPAIISSVDYYELIFGFRQDIIAWQFSLASAEQSSANEDEYEVELLLLAA